jgi:hypothetical protein
MKKIIWLVATLLLVSSIGYAGLKIGNPFQQKGGTVVGGAGVSPGTLDRCKRLLAGWHDNENCTSQNDCLTRFEAKNYLSKASGSTDKGGWYDRGDHKIVYTLNNNGRYQFDCTGK